MSSSRRRRRILIGVSAVIVLILAVLLIRGIVEKRRETARDRIDDAIDRAAAGGGSQQSQSGSSGSQGSDSSSAEDSSGQLAPPQSPPEEDNSGAIGPVENSPGFVSIVDQNVTPFRTTPGHNMAFWAQIQGDAVSVSMSIADTAGAGGAFSVNLGKGPTTDGLTSWSYNGTAPSIPGTYSYSATAISSDGHSVHEQGATVIVE